MNLQNKVGIVTGAATGIGRAISTHLVHDGAAVANERTIWLVSEFTTWPWT